MDFEFESIGEIASSISAYLGFLPKDETDWQARPLGDERTQREIVTARLLEYRGEAMRLLPNYIRIPAAPADGLSLDKAKLDLHHLADCCRAYVQAHAGETVGGQKDYPLKFDPLAVEEDAVLSPRNLAEKWGILPLLGALQSRLKRFRESNPSGNGTHWIEINDAKPREAKFWFRVRYVRPILDTLKATSERPAKNLLPR
jgi:hypothetical protein